MDAATSLHHQVAVTLQREIQSGEFGQGALFATEKQLVGRFGVSTTTVRRALQTLVDAGYLTRKAGRGTFVRRPRFERYLSPLLGSLEDMEARGIAATARVLAVGQRLPEPEVAERLRVKDGEPMFWMRRLLFAGEEPVAIEEGYWPAEIGAVLAGQDLTTPLYRFVEEHLGTPLGEAEASLEARAASAEQAALLLVPEGSPVLVTERAVYAADGRPVDFDRTVFRGDRYRFKTRMVRSPQRRVGL